MKAEDMCRILQEQGIEFERKRFPVGVFSDEEFAFINVAGTRLLLLASLFEFEDELRVFLSLLREFIESEKRSNLRGLIDTIGYR